MANPMAGLLALKAKMLAKKGAATKGAKGVVPDGDVDVDVEATESISEKKKEKCKPKGKC